MIKIGPAGSGLGNVEGIIEVKQIGLDCLEIEFTYGVWMKDEAAKKIGEEARKQKIELSVHAPYYINLNSKEKEKVEASKRRILQSCERAHQLGAKYVVFHAAFYHKDDPETVFEKVKKEMLLLMEEINKRKWEVILCPETTGKKSQFGELDELLRLKQETGCGLCVDFAHILAREGKIDYDSVMPKLKGHVHAHFSGIEYGEKGEKRHELTSEKDIKRLLDKLIEHKIDCTIINESPDPVGDSLKTKKILEKLKK